MITKDVVGALLYRIPKIITPLWAGAVLSSDDDRMYGSSEHPEFDNILSGFTEESKIIIVFGVTEIFALIQKVPETNKLKTVIIEGENTDIEILSRGGLADRLSRVLTVNDFFPTAMTKKVVYIDKYDKKYIEGVVFSEYLRNEWTTNDPMQLGEEATIKKFTGNGLIKNLIEGIYDGQKAKEEEK